MQMKTGKIYLCATIAIIAFSGTFGEFCNARENAALSMIDQRFHHAAQRAQIVHLSGFGTLWKQTTGLNDNVGLTFRDKTLLVRLLQSVRCTERKRVPGATLDKGGIFVAFLIREADGGYSYAGEFQYWQRDEKAFLQDDSIDIGPYLYGVAMQPGYQMRFTTFVSDLTKRARHRDHAVSLYHHQSSE